MRNELARGRGLPILALALMAIMTWGGCSASSPSPDDGQKIAAAFLDEIRAGRVDAAWAGTTAEFKSLLGMEGLRGLAKKQPALREPVEFVGYAPVERNGLALAECTFRSPKRGKSVKVVLAREGGDWKVERLSLE